MKKIGVLIDSGTGLTIHEAQNEGFEFYPLLISDQNNKTYKDDGVDLPDVELFKRLRNKEMFKTSLCPIGIVQMKIEELLEDKYEHLIIIPLSSGLSGQYASIQVILNGEEDLAKKCTLIDYKAASQGQLFAARKALELVNKGHSPEEIKTLLENNSGKHGAVIVPNDINHLIRGGRVTGAKALIGKLLDIKPIIRFIDGKLIPIGKSRNFKNAMTEGLEILKVDLAKQNILDYDVELVTFDIIVGDPDKKLIEDTKKAIKEVFNVDVTKTVKASNIIIIHAGISTIGVYFIYRKIK